MKNIIFLIVFLMSGMCYGQKDFIWEKIDSVPKSKSQIYSDTKLFIAEEWKSAQSVIQNDDKDAGIVLIKGASTQNIFFQLNDHIYSFYYTISFYMKENKYRILINNVYCYSGRCGNYEWPKMDCSDSYPGFKNAGMNENRYFTLMNNLKNELQAIFNSYIKFISSPISPSKDW